MTMIAFEVSEVISTNWVNNSLYRKLFGCWPDQLKCWRVYMAQNHRKPLIERGVDQIKLRRGSVSETFRVMA